MISLKFCNGLRQVRIPSVVFWLVVLTVGVVYWWLYSWGGFLVVLSVGGGSIRGRGLLMGLRMGVVFAGSSIRGRGLLVVIIVGVVC